MPVRRYLFVAAAAVALLLLGGSGHARTHKPRRTARPRSFTKPGGSPKRHRAGRASDFLLRPELWHMNRCSYIWHGRNPPVPTSHRIRVYAGVRVPDPYSPLEHRDAWETRQWALEENRLTYKWLRQIPKEDWLAASRRYDEVAPRESFWPLWRCGRSYFYFHCDDSHDYDVVYQTRSLRRRGRAVLDPARFDKSGSLYLADARVSPNGRYLAYALSIQGSDWLVWRFRDLSTGRDLRERLHWTMAGGAFSWSPDSSGVLYSRFLKPPHGMALRAKITGEKICFHRLHVPEEKDVVIYAIPHGASGLAWSFFSDDGRFLVLGLNPTPTDATRYFIRPLARSGRVNPISLRCNWRSLPVRLPRRRHNLLIGNIGPIFYFQTVEGAPGGEVIAVDSRRSLLDAIRVVVPETDDILASVGLVGQKLLLVYLRRLRPRLAICGANGRCQRNLPLPGCGTLSTMFTGDPIEATYSFSSFTCPDTICQCDVRGRRTTLFQPEPPRFRPKEYVSRLVHYRSKDGTQVPMFLCYRRSTRLCPGTPCYLHGYGAFDIPMLPDFSPWTILWMDLGGVYAQPCLRGGGELGEQWHRAATATNKQTTVDDFIAAAQWLCAHRYTSPHHLAVVGGSMGGIPVGAFITQRPDLCAAAVIEAGVLDPLDFDRCGLTWGLQREYGSVKKPSVVRAMLAYAPLQNVRQGVDYPATFIMTGDHDNRVSPSDSYKFAAALQLSQAGNAPILLKTYPHTGHAWGHQWDMARDSFQFLIRVLRIHMPARFYRKHASHRG